jgi:hypothetical protein
MKQLCIVAMGTLCALALSVSAVRSADFFGDALKKGLPQLPEIGSPSANKAKGAGLDESTIASGLKNALSLGTKKAVGAVSKTDGYFANEAIKILLPDNIQKAAELASKLGFRKQVDDFIISMNRAAEKAAPKATAHFVDAIKAMTLDDARGILAGGDTSATDYFRSKTSSKLYDEFKPSISQSMSQVGVARAYEAMVSKVPANPLMKTESMDLDRYVTTKALDGLFYMVGEEEKKIRTNPAARTTDLLKKVFGRQ